MNPTPPDFECHLQFLYEVLLGPGDVAVDVGAHRGRHALPLARRVLPSGKVFAFEPLPACRTALERKVALEPELASVLTLSADALGASDGTAEFVVACDDPGYSGLRERPYDRPTRLERIPVRVRRLDDVLSGLETPSSCPLRFIKIDAEGGELDILRGATDILARFRPVVAFECGARALQGYGAGPDDVAAFWAAAGYRVYSIAGEWLPPAAFVLSATTENLWDYVAVPDDNPALEELARATLQRGWRLGPVLRDLAASEDWNAQSLQAPSLAHRRRPGRVLAGAVVWVVLRLSRFLVSPQRALNRSLLKSVRHLLTELVRAEERVESLERRLEVWENDPGVRRAS
jgi:FkbM family methyltransferase